MFVEFIRDNYSRSDIIKFWNKYRKAKHFSTESVYPMEQFTTICGDSFQDIFPRIIRFSTTDKYFKETDTGLIYTYEDELQVFERVIRFYDLLTWLLENPQDDKMKTYIEENRRK